MASDFHICAAIFKFGSAHAPQEFVNPESPVHQITMDGKSAAGLFREIKADVYVPMY